MHRDEQRDPFRLEQQLSEDFASDPLASYAKFRGMAAREKQARRQLEALQRRQRSDAEESSRLRRQHRSLTERNERLQEHNDRLRQRIETLAEREARLQDRLRHLTEKNATLTDRARRWKERSTILQERMTHLRSEEDAGTPTLADLTRTTERLTESREIIASLQQELDRLRGDEATRHAMLPDQPRPEPEPQAEPQPGPETEPQRETEPESAARSEAEAESASRSETELESEKTEPQSVARPEAEPEPTEESDSDKEADPEESQQQPEPAAPTPTAPRASLAELHTFEELRERMTQQPSVEVLHGALLRAWYRDGEVSRALHLLEEHPSLAAELNRPGQIVVERLRGFDRLSKLGAGWIPPRSSGAAYVPERNRVMYCVHSTPIYQSNGYATRTRGIAQAIRSAGSEVRVVGRAGYPWDTRDIKHPTPERNVSRLDDIEYVHLPGPNEHRDPLDHIVLEMADAFVREARLYRPSVIQAASNYRTGLAAVIAGRRLGIPVVYEIRGLWEFNELAAKPDWGGSERFLGARHLEGLVASEADHVLAITAQVADEMVKRGVPRDRISLAPNGVDPKQFAPLYRDDSVLSGAGIPDDGMPVIGFAGSMVDYEGLSLLLHASRLLGAQNIPHRVLLVGSGPAQQSLRQYASEHGMDHVHFLGRVPQQRVPRLMSGIDVVVCPRLSTPVTELVSPLKPLEAMGSGTAVVLSDVAPHCDLAGQGRAALFRAGDAQHLAETLAPLLVDRDARAVLARRARAWTTHHRSWHTIGQDIVAAHRRVEGAPGHAPRAVGSKTLADLRVGIVADEFTRTTLGAQVRLEVLGRQTWRRQLQAAPLDLVILESAWATNDEWHRGVGFYSPEENADFRKMVALCRDLGIPTVFWNKEDPVHFNRFVRSAIQCDHVFTTDGATIPEYLRRAAAAGRSITASSMPFYAAPSLHNPLPGKRDLEAGASYAGTYYGSRYPERSEVLAALLRTATPFGLTVYDRQLAVPDSPYHFPAEFSEYIQGALPYEEVLDSYKSHIASLNVNSVIDSPTMYSRRVVEIAASGGVVLSGPGRGITETFGTSIACSPQEQTWRAWLRSWSTDPHARLEEAWLQMRAVLRAHTTENALTIMARTAGIQVRAEGLMRYIAHVPQPDRATLRSLINQSVAPAELLLGREVPNAWLTGLSATVAVRVDKGETIMDSAVMRFDRPRDRTFAEDLLHTMQWRAWAWVDSHELGTDETGRSFAIPSSDDRWEHAQLRVPGSAGRSGLLLTRPTGEVEHQDDEPIESFDVAAPIPDMKGVRLLVAGHDLKFATALIAAAEAAGAAVETDLWTSHTEHDERASQELLDRADVVLCEWGLGNAVWYSRHVAPHQRLVVRVHAQELRRPYLSRIKKTAVDRFVFVGELIRHSAVVSHGVPADKAVVIPNGVDIEALRLPKTDTDVSRHLGLVGIVPQAKRLDLALDVLERVRQHDRAYRLFIKGKTPSDFPWMAHRPEEMAYYDDQFARIDALNSSAPGTVTLDPHGDDMPDWFRKIGVALSVSDHESFHFTPADGAASGALPAILAWPGADLIYPHSWLSSDLDELAHRILTSAPAGDGDVIAKTYAQQLVVPQLLAQLVAR